jgi:hypothetical protein
MSVIKYPPSTKFQGSRCFKDFSWLDDTILVQYFYLFKEHYSEHIKNSCEPFLNMKAKAIIMKLELWSEYLLKDASESFPAFSNFLSV